MNPATSPRPFSLRAFFTGVGIIGGLNVLLQLSGIIALPIVTRLLGTAHYGTLTQASTVIIFFLPLATLGLTTAVARLLAGVTDVETRRERFFSAFCFVVVCGSLWAFGVFLSARLIATWVGCPPAEGAHVLRILSLTIPLTAGAGICSEYLRAVERPLPCALTTLLQRSLYLGALVVAGGQGWNLFQLAGAIVVAQVVSLLLSAAIVVRDVGFACPRFQGFEEYLRFGVPLVPTAFLYWVIHSGDRLLIGQFLSPAAVGVYTAAYTLATLAYKIAEPIYFVLLPTASRLLDKKEIQACQGHLSYAVKFYLLLAVPVACGLTVLARPLLHVMTTEEFVSGSALLPVIAMGFLLLQTMGVGECALMLAQRTGTILLLLIPVAILNVLLNLVLLPLIGLMGAALATLVSYGTLGALSYAQGSRYLTLTIPAGFVARCLLAAAAMAAFLRLTTPHGAVGWLMVLGGGALVYGGTLTVLTFYQKRKSWTAERLRDMVTFHDAPRRAFRLLMD